MPALAIVIVLAAAWLYNARSQAAKMEERKRIENARRRIKSGQLNQEDARKYGARRHDDHVYAGNGK